MGLVRRWVKLCCFYLQDPQGGRLVLRRCPSFPHNGVAWLNGPEWLACQLRRQGSALTQRDNRFLDCAQPQRRQELADAFAPQDVTAAVETWLAPLLPCFSAAERHQGYRHPLYLAQRE